MSQPLPVVPDGVHASCPHPLSCISHAEGETAFLSSEQAQLPPSLGIISFDATQLLKVKLFCELMWTCLFITFDQGAGRAAFVMTSGQWVSRSWWPPSPLSLPGESATGNNRHTLPSPASEFPNRGILCKSSVSQPFSDTGSDSWGQGQSAGVSHLSADKART